MVTRLLFDVYGRFRVTADRPADGPWEFFRDGPDGKRSRVFDVYADEDETVEGIVRALEATYHELATPGRTIVRLE